MDRLGGDGVALLILRWALIAALTFWAWRRRSLTTWILLSMVVGAEVGTTGPESRSRSAC